MTAQLLLHMVLDVEGKPVFQETADFAAILPVTVTD